MKSDSELQKLRYDNKELREASDRFCDRIKALEQIKVIQRKLLADAGHRNEVLEAALREADACIIRGSAWTASKTIRAALVVGVKVEPDLPDGVAGKDQRLPELPLR